METNSHHMKGVLNLNLSEGKFWKKKCLFPTRLLSHQLLLLRNPSRGLAGYLYQVSPRPQVQRPAESWSFFKATDTAFHTPEKKKTSTTHVKEKNKQILPAANQFSPFFSPPFQPTILDLGDFGKFSVTPWSSSGSTKVPLVNTSQGARSTQTGPGPGVYPVGLLGRSGFVGFAPWEVVVFEI